MRWFNLGKKDAYGKQRRIEHRGKNLRISRTGGVALRTQTKRAGLSVTANTKHGLRVSTRVAKNTHIALQNGRPVLRGRYGRGPTKLNLSKSGVSVSTRNAIGTFNWFKPNRSSVKIAGVQLRGKKAANIQLTFMLLTAAAQGLLFFWHIFSLILRLTVHLAREALYLILSLPEHLQRARQALRNRRITSQLAQTQALFSAYLEHWDDSDLQTAFLLLLIGWGRGITATEAATRIQLRLKHASPTPPVLPNRASTLDTLARQLEDVRTQHEYTLTRAQNVTALLAQQHLNSLTAEQTVDSFLNADEWAVTLGEKTVLQEQLIQIFAEFAQLRLQPDPEQIITATPEPTTGQASHLASGLINLNTATAQQLQSLPHIGTERAQAIIALRPITTLTQLTTIHGIGPARLADIEHAGIEL